MRKFAATPRDKHPHHELGQTAPMQTELSKSRLDQSTPFQEDFASGCTCPGNSWGNVTLSSVAYCAQQRAHSIACAGIAAMSLHKSSCKIAHLQKRTNASMCGIDWHSKTQAILLLQKQTAFTPQRSSNHQRLSYSFHCVTRTYGMLLNTPAHPCCPLDRGCKSKQEAKQRRVDGSRQSNVKQICQDPV